MGKSLAQMEINSREWYLHRCSKKPCHLTHEDPKIKIPEYIQKLCSRGDCMYGDTNIVNTERTETPAPAGTRAAANKLRGL